MKHKFISVFTITFLAVASFTVAAVDQPQGPKQPIYIYLYARITDHINLGITEDRIHRVVSVIDKYRRAYPKAHVSATLLFSGAVSEALAQRNSQTHIVDFVKRSLRRGIIEAGYDGSDEPTYVTRPAVDLTGASDPQSRWLERVSSEQKLLTEGRDPLTGATEPGKAGGLKEMQKVFGEADCITGVDLLMKVGPGGLLRTVTRARVLDQGPKPVTLPPGLMPEVGGDSEAVRIIRALNSKAIMFGIPDTNPGRIPGFREGRAGFSRLISPIPETAPELYWQDDVLRSSEAGGDPVRLVHAYLGADPIEKLVEKADRTRVHVVHVELADELNYLQPEFVKGPDFPALQYAYNHPQSPELSASALRQKSDVDAAYANEEALLTWVTATFFPSNPGSRFVSSTDLAQMVAPPTGFSVSIGGLKAALAGFLKEWGSDTFSPPLFRADGHYLSRAELFQVTADALAEFHRNGKFPASITVAPVYGPVRVLTGHGPNMGEVSVAALAGICANIAPSLHGQSSGPVPENAIPIGIPIEGAMLNPAQFLRLMAFAILNPSPDAKLNIRMAYEFMGVGQLMPRTRPDMDDGFIWTIKPAQLEASFTRPANP
jgi:hypothetical protein